MIGGYFVANDITFYELHEDIAAELYNFELKDASTTMSMPTELTNVPTPTCRVINTSNKHQNIISHTVIPKQSPTNPNSFNFDYSLKTLNFASAKEFFVFMLRHLII